MKIHLIGIGGTGMASLAGMLKASGHEVRGSDQGVYPPMSHLLEQLQIPVYSPYSEKNLEWNPELVIIGNAISKGHVEAEYVLTHDFAYQSMPQAIRQFFLRDKSSLVVAGTHGKTTTTSLLSWILESSGLAPSFFVGGKPKNFPQNFKLGLGKYFVLEGDEYDTAFFDKGPKFLHYQPEHVLLTSVEFDHADIYRDLEHVLESFRKLLRLIPERGSLVANLDYQNIRNLLLDYPKPPITYATQSQLRSEVDYFGEVLSLSPQTLFRITARDGRTFETSFKLPGLHNISNATGAVALAFRLGLSWDQIQKGLETFEGVRRRQDLLFDENGISIYDDFAHHPTAVRETIAALRARFPNRRLWAIFEPRSNSSKRNVFQKDYAESFKEADRVLIADVFLPQKVKDAQVLDVDYLTSEINQHSPEKKADHISGLDNMLTFLLGQVAPGDVLLFMSNGDFGGLPTRVKQGLQQ